MTALDMGPNPAANFPALDAALRAALPGQLDGISWDKHGNLTVIVTEGRDAEALRPQIAAVIAAHNPSVLTPAQTLAARRVTAADDLQAADFAAVLAQINAATTLADAKPILKKLLALTYRLALAQGMTDATDPGA
jgi:predicted hydrolase (HD superfamily)